MEFDLPKEQSSIIKVIGVGGGGCNAVKYMYNQGIVGVNFVICNTDAQSLESSSVPNPIQLGPKLTEGLGAGSRPEVGRQAAEESLNEIKEILEKKTKMVFITAGLGGGTGTGAAPLIAETAKSMGILTVSIVTTPFSFEGRRKINQAMEGLELLKKNSDAYIVVSNDKLRDIFANMTRSEAFAQADNVLATAAKAIAEIITIEGNINTDFADVEYVMRDSGVSIMGSAVAGGEDRAIKAISEALSSPLLSDNDINGAKNILLNISSGKNEIRVEEIDQINRYIEERAGDPDLIMGVCDDESLDDEISVTIIATGFDKKNTELYPRGRKSKEKGKTRINLDDDFNRDSIDYKKKAEEKEEEPDNQFKLELDLEDTEQEQKTAEKEESFTFEFDDIKGKDEEEKEDEFMVRELSEEEKQQMRYEAEEKSEEVEEQQPNHQIDHRKAHLESLSMKISRGKARIEDLEKEPAYKRKGIISGSSNLSGEDNISRYTLDESDDEDGKPKLNKNNSFLHDNID